jgi:hypothetical protein
VIAVPSATLDRAPRTCTSGKIGVVRHVRNSGEGRAGGGGGAHIDEEEGGRGRGGCIFIRQGAFLTMEHLLATMVSVPLSPGRMHIHSVRGIFDNGALVGDYS